jgi:hypothetical protein
MKFFGRTTTNNFGQIKIITPYHAYYKTVLLNLQFEYFMTLILSKT